MSLDPQLQEALKVRQAQADDASAVFDFESEGSLATFWRQATPGTTYWRGYVPMKHLPGSVQPIQPDSLELVSDAPLEIKLNRQVGDTAIWQFLGDDARSRIVFQMQKQGLRTLMEVDDSYLTLAPTLYGKASAWTKTHADAVRNGTGYSVEMHRKQAPRVDGIICATEHLAEEYSAVNDVVYHCPNSIDPDDWDVERTESDVLRIGYYGSMSHVRDYPLVKKALKWAARQPGVEIVMIGFVPPAFSGRSYPWADNLYDARKPLGSIDVGICPLTRNRWADGKSDVKALEYTMAGAVPVVQDAPPYSPWVNDGWPLVAKTEQDWADIIKEIVHMSRADLEGYAVQARQYVLNYRTIQGNIDSWRRAIRG